MFKFPKLANQPLLKWKCRRSPILKFKRPDSNSAVRLNSVVAAFVLVRLLLGIVILLLDILDIVGFANVGPE